MVDASIRTATPIEDSTATNEQSNHRNNDESGALFLQAYGLGSLSFTTTWRWMCLREFSYDTCRKGFYADGHERKDVVDNRVQLCKKYLTEYEPYCKCWIQVCLEKADNIKELDLSFGYHYPDIISNEQRVEFHINYWMQIQSKLPAEEQTHHNEDPNISIRTPRGARPLMNIGQDESVFAQYLMMAKNWMGPNGEVPLLPKSEGDGYVFSAFISREFGFGRHLTN